MASSCITNCLMHVHICINSKGQNLEHFKHSVYKRSFPADILKVTFLPIKCNKIIDISSINMSLKQIMKSSTSYYLCLKPKISDTKPKDPKYPLYLLKIHLEISPNRCKNTLQRYICYIVLHVVNDSLVKLFYRYLVQFLMKL